MRDQRLDLGRYVRNPFNKKGDIGKRLDFHALFKENARSGRYPWNPDRFDTSDLLKRQQTRKLKLNPDLNFVGNSPFFDENQQVTSQYELFEGVGRFNRPEAYDFAEGRPLTPQRPQNQPDFNPFWVEAYRISPTLPLTNNQRTQCREMRILIQTDSSWRWRNNKLLLKLKATPPLLDWKQGNNLLKNKRHKKYVKVKNL